MIGLTQQQTVFGIRSHVLAALSEASGVDADEIQDNMLLQGDPGQGDLGIGLTLGSGEFLDLKCDLERRTGVEIPTEKLRSPEKLAQLRVSDVIRFFECPSFG